MADLEDARRIGRSLPDTAPDGFSVVRGAKLRGFAWTWNERIDPKRPKTPNREVLAIRTTGLDEKAGLIASDPGKFFTEPHYDNFPAVLLRLATVDSAELEELLTAAWRICATKRAVRDLEAARECRSPIESGEESA